MQTQWNPERRSTRMYCQKLRRPGCVTLLTSFYAHPRLCRFANSQSDVFEALVEEGESSPDSYWAWWNFKDRQFQFVFSSRLCVSACFAGGIDAAEARGEGVCLPVSITVGARAEA